MQKKIILSAVILAVLAGIFILKTADGNKSNFALPSTSSATKGDSNAPVTIIIYSDFQCPACATAGPYLDELFKKYPGKIYMIYRYYPLEAHRNGFSSAVAAECAKAQGKFWEYHDLLFKRQTEWGNGLLPISLNDPTNRFSIYATELKLNVGEFNQCLSSQSTQKMVLESRQEGDSLQVASTPTFFVNSHRVVGIKSLQATADGFIQEALKKK